MTHLAKRLNNVLEARPFDSLGVFPQDKAWLIRVFLPDVDRVRALSIDGTVDYGAMDQAGPGLFELCVEGADKPVYSLQVEKGKDSWRVVDAYQFTERALEDFPCSSDTLYKTMGAQLCSTPTRQGPLHGVRFAVYAPNARSVSVVGDFNHWDGRIHPMQSSEDGIWRLFVPELAAGAKYKFELKDMRGHLLPHKSDPYNFYCAQYPEFNSIVFDHSQYPWQDQAWQAREIVAATKAPMTTYELHVGSWRHIEGRPMTYRELADHLIPYLCEMNFSHVEFVPISEHPFDGSWGYQPLGLFAPTSRYGTPDDFKYFVDQCHQQNIAVLVDWVPAHFPSDTHGLARFDGTALYEYEDPQRGWHPDWNSYIYDFGRFTVRDFLISSALVWLDYFHIDGLRVDAVASMLYLDYSRESGEWVPNVNGGNHNYEAIELVKRFNTTVYGRFPKAITIAEESTAFDGVTRPVFAGGLGFGFKWNMGWMHDSLAYIGRDPVHRAYHHDELTFSMVYSFNENFVLPLSHDEVVHGKGSILARMPGDEWQKTANLRAYYGYMYGHPGKKLNFMGNEFAQGIEWNHQAQLDWYLLQFERHSGMQNLFKDLNRLHRDEAALHQRDCDPSGFRWLNHSDSAASVFSFARFGDQGELVLVVSNMTPTPHARYRIGVPSAGQYEVILNTDSHYYGGSNYHIANLYDSTDEPANGLEFSLDISVPPLATIFLKRI
ncbi:MAG: 1,4-alpha-glucan branching protein GlgB [Reinekea forsetii]|nr:1,4-alpha-glucan branching protein GlgB [Reinekea forsetii]